MTYYPPRYLFRRFEILKRIRPGNNFLEIGPGNLNLSRELLLVFNKGTLIDYNEDARNLYQGLPVADQKRLDLIIADFSSHLFHQKFDCIVACEVLEHVHHDSEFIQKAYELLNHKGQIILSVPSRKKYWSIHDETVGHLRRYEKNEIIDLLSRNNFINIEVISYGFPFVNILRWPGNALARYNYQEKRKWNQKKQSQKSGIVQAGRLANATGLLVNKYTCAPLSIVAALFNKTDLSNGYVITANKSL